MREKDTLYPILRAPLCGYSTKADRAEALALHSLASATWAEGRSRVGVPLLPRGGAVGFGDGLVGGFPRARSSILGRVIEGYTTKASYVPLSYDWESTMS